MTTCETKTKVQAFINENRIDSISYNQLKSAIERKGYTVVEFNTVINSEPVEILFRELSLANWRQHTKGFTYADSKYRIIFIREDLIEPEKAIVLAHEIGHAVCGHMSNTATSDTDVRQEYEANEFMHYLCREKTKRRLAVKCFIRKHRRMILLSIAAVLAVIVCTWAMAAGKNTDADTAYYITPNGQKYHTADCKYTKDNPEARLMTQSEYDRGLYTSCKVCLPQ